MVVKTNKIVSTPPSMYITNTSFSISAIILKKKVITCSIVKGKEMAKEDCESLLPGRKYYLQQNTPKKKIKQKRWFFSFRGKIPRFKDTGNLLVNLFVLLRRNTYTVLWCHGKQFPILRWKVTMVKPRHIRAGIFDEDNNGPFIFWRINGIFLLKLLPSIPFNFMRWDNSVRLNGFSGIWKNSITILLSSMDFSLLKRFPRTLWMFIIISSSTPIISDPIVKLKTDMSPLKNL